MKTLMDYPVPKNEGKRIKVLWEYDILDTVPEEVFDELANLAGLICGAPISQSRKRTSARRSSRSPMRLLPCPLEFWWISVAA